jgi:hypothetical protein
MASREEKKKKNNETNQNKQFDREIEETTEIGKGKQVGGFFWITTGRLSPIVSQPEKAFMSEETRASGANGGEEVSDGRSFPDERERRCTIL